MSVKKKKNTNANSKGWLHELRLSIFIYLEKLSFLQLFISFFLIAFIFAFLFYLLSPGDHGIIISGVRDISFGNALYFSVVTISSLGYGDMFPLGFSKFLSAIEVLLGLGMMGMLIAKLTSSRLSYHVKRLYISDANRQIYRSNKYFRDCVTKIDNSIEKFSILLIDTPGSALNKVSFNDEVENIRRAFNANFINLHKTVGDFKSFIDLEVKNGDFFAEVPQDKIKEIGETLYQGIKTLDQLFLSLTDEKLKSLLYGKPGINCNKIIQNSEELAQIINEKASEKNTRLIYSNIENQCKSIRNNFSFVEIKIHEQNQPNQINKESDISE